MASMCPKCRRPVEDDSICLADINLTWKCKSCGNLTTGFIFPYGRCSLCGGEKELTEEYGGASGDLVAIAREAVQFEVDTYLFYRMAAQKTKDEVLRPVLEDLRDKEEKHLRVLENKYHVHFDQDLRQLPDKDEQIVFRFIFHGLDFKGAEGHVLQVYNKAIGMEKRTRNRYLAHANALPPGPHQEFYRKLAGEEEIHVKILEAKREQFLKPS